MYFISDNGYKNKGYASIANTLNWNFELIVYEDSEEEALKTAKQLLKLLKKCITTQ